MYSTDSDSVISVLQREKVQNIILRTQAQNFSILDMECMLGITGRWVVLTVALALGGFLRWMKLSWCLRLRFWDMTWKLWMGKYRPPQNLERWLCQTGRPRFYIEREKFRGYKELSSSILNKAAIKINKRHFWPTYKTKPPRYGWFASWDSRKGSTRNWREGQWTQPQ